MVRSSCCNDWRWSPLEFHITIVLLVLAAVRVWGERCSCLEPSRHWCGHGHPGYRSGEGCGWYALQMQSGDWQIGTLKLVASLWQLKHELYFRYAAKGFDRRQLLLDCQCSDWASLVSYLQGVSTGPKTSSVRLFLMEKWKAVVNTVPSTICIYIYIYRYIWHTYVQYILPFPRACMHHMTIYKRLLFCKVEKGRSIYAGIQKFVAFIMSVHIAEAREVATAVWGRVWGFRCCLFHRFSPRSCRSSFALLWASRFLGPFCKRLFLPSCYWLPVSHQWLRSCAHPCRSCSWSLSLIFLLLLLWEWSQVPGTLRLQGQRVDEFRHAKKSHRRKRTSINQRKNEVPWVFLLVLMHLVGLCNGVESLWFCWSFAYAGEANILKMRPRPKDDALEDFGWFWVTLQYLQFNTLLSQRSRILTYILPWLSACNNLLWYVIHLWFWAAFLLQQSIGIDRQQKVMVAAFPYAQAKTMEGSERQVEHSIPCKSELSRTVEWMFPTISQWISTGNLKGT